MEGSVVSVMSGGECGVMSGGECGECDEWRGVW